MSSRRLPTWLIEDYLEVLFGSEDLGPEERQREAIEHHAELNYRLNGGGRCGICRSHVRHVVQVSVQKNRETQNYRCLCTRCLEGERSTADLVSLTLGKATITYQRRESDVKTKRWTGAELAQQLAAKRVTAGKG
ncbi:MAG: hypothetical protein JOZ44_02775 [Acidobacteria bacterium]|nr:hypothetical protein [Acidobacteriota bacterium]